MSRRRDKPLDIFKRLQVVRSIDDLIYDEDAGTFEKSKAMESDFFKATPVVKKKLNIPVTDIAQDKKYDDESAFSAPFVLPTSYVRHIKIMGDEADITLDYCIEDEDLAWLKNNAKIAADPELTATLTNSMFERVIDMLEKNTGFSDPIPMQMATTLVCHHIQLPLQIASKMIQELYPYWISKRNKLHKPLNRKFWPATAPNDTNPHLVFRPREKERYRLRRHHKNDLQSFRKMQSLRREFARARVLMELVLERELIKKADMEVSSEIFEQQLRSLSELAGGAGKELLMESSLLEQRVPSENMTDMKIKMEVEEGKMDIDNNGSVDEKVGDAKPQVPPFDPLRYKFRFPHLVSMLEPPKKLVAPPPVLQPPAEQPQKLKLTLKIKPSKPSKAARVEPVVPKESKEEKASRKKQGKSEAVPRGRKRDRAGLTKDGEPIPEGMAPPAKPPKVPVVKEKKPPKEAKPKKEKEPKEKKEAKDKENAGNKKVVAAAQVMQPLGGRVTIDAKGRMVLHPNQHGNSKADSSGGSEILLNERLCRMKESMWPTFMDKLNTREKIYAPRSMSEYMSDLELSEEDPPPNRFRLRGRIGRGGRVVMDRIPIYDRCHDPETWSSQTDLQASRSSAHSVSNHYDYIYPTTLHPARQQEHVKMFASHFRQESYFKAGLPHVLQPECSDVDITSVFSIPTTNDEMDVDDIADKNQNSYGVAPEAASSNVVPAFGGKIKPSNHATVLPGANVDAAVKSNNAGEGMTPRVDEPQQHTIEPLTIQTESLATVDTKLKAEVCLSPTSAEGNSSTTLSSLGGNTIALFPGVNTAEYQSAYKYSDDLTMFALLIPPERDALFSLPSHREQDLFRLSDQRPKDIRNDPQLPLVFQANELVPREDEDSECIISMPRRFKCPQNSTHSINNQATSASMTGSSRTTSTTTKSTDQKGSSKGTSSSNTDSSASKSSATTTLPVTDVDNSDTSADVASRMDTAPVKYVLYV